ncbi:MAG: hypothetical protein ACUBOA_04010 [Candidatus Loosdrechtia sp.]|uniref:hypothetical protein n=1 Tax=Candidatus Loosdrechtia sp. TaxID=3101272 RepID=UPI003A77334D|nr:MAG: hypothetical protein QY305_07680 [Candidatus Jettenia sp. AMX2]
MHDLKNLSDKDLLFLIENYVTTRQDYEKIATLIRGDTDIIGKMVDSDLVFEKILAEGDKILQFSPYLLFIFLVRRIFKRKKDDRQFIEEITGELNSTRRTYPWNERRVKELLSSTDVPNYLANMLSLFIQTTRFYQIKEDEEKHYRYLVDMIGEIKHSDTTRRFHIYCHIGNYTLFFTGMFPEHLGYKFSYKKSLVDNRYYVDFGKTYFGLASEHAIARQQELDDTLHSLSEGFEIITKLLQSMRNEYFHK